MYVLLTRQRIWGGGEQFLVDVADALVGMGLDVCVIAPRESEIARRRPELLGRPRAGSTYIANEFHQYWRSVIRHPLSDHRMVFHGPWQTSRIRNIFVRLTRGVPYAISQDVAKQISRVGYLRDPLIVLSAGPDLRRFSVPTVEARSAARAAFGLPMESQAVAFIGRLQEIKRIRLYADTLAALPDRIHGLVLTPRPVTDGDHRQLMALDRIADRCVLLHDAPPEEVLTAADLLLSTSEYESLGIAMMEAIACGVRVATTARGGPMDFITEDNGAIYATDDPNLLARMILDSGLLRPQAAEDRARVRGTLEKRGPATVAAQFLLGVRG